MEISRGTDPVKALRLNQAAVMIRDKSGVGLASANFITGAIHGLSDEDCGRVLKVALAYLVLPRCNEVT